MRDEAAVRAHLGVLFRAAFGRSADEAAAAGAGAGLAAGRAVLASAPGRLEVAGNHVDHQGGRVISAAIGERTWGLAVPNDDGRIRVVMEGFGADEIDLAEEGWDVPRPADALSSGALVRGMAARFARDGGALGGFDMVTCSDVPSGCGLSSSAAFEVMVGACLAGLFGGGAWVACAGAEADAGGSALASAAGADAATGSASADTQGEGAVALDPVALALAATQVEQRYFGKPCGAQDQLASACGGVVTIDFKPAVPVVEVVHLDAAAQGFGILLIDSRQDHSQHNDEFAAIPADMGRVARLLGMDRLGDGPAEELLDQLGTVRAALGDQCALRALHYYDEVARVRAQRAALERGDFAAFLGLVRASGVSSAQFLQNVSLRGPGTEGCQPAMVIQGLCAHWLGDRGAWRIHGGGFGGAVLAFVPLDEVDGFAAAMDAALGYEACRTVVIGGAGAWARRLP